MKAFLLTLSVLLAFIRENNGQPIVKRLPWFPLVFVGDDITLECQGTGQPITWEMNGKPQSYEGSSIFLSMVTPENNGNYTCQRNNVKSAAYTLTVLELEPSAQLSLPPGGAVISKGEARVLTLHVEEELDKWECFVLRNTSAYKLYVLKDGMNTASVHAELKDAQRATFWCMIKETKDRTNVVTLKMTQRMVMLEPAVPVLKKGIVTLRCTAWGGAEVVDAEFYKDDNIISTEKKNEYTITNATESNNGQYKCTATYKYSHISAMAAKKTGESDPQELKVIGGPPVASLANIKHNRLGCSCRQCKPNCNTFQWYYSNNSKIRTRRSETDSEIYIADAGWYMCRASCEGGFSRFSEAHRYQEQFGGTVWVILTACLIILGVLIIVLVALKRKRRGEMQTGRDKDGKKDKSGGDYEQIGLTENALYHTLDEAKAQAKDEGGYEALKKTDEPAVYHTLKAAEGSSQAEGQGEGQAQGQGGYESLQNVKVQVYQTLSSEKSEKPKGESEGGYEQLPQKTGDYQDVTVEENPYEELKAEKQQTQKKE